MALRVVARPPFLERVPAAPPRAERRQATGFSWAGPLEQNVTQWPDAGSESYLADTYSKVPIVYACIGSIASSAAEAPIKPYVGQGVDRKVQTGTPLTDLLERPNRFQRWFGFAEQFHVYQQATGNAFVFKVRNNVGAVIELRLLRTGRMHVIPGANGPQSWIYRINGQDYPIAPEDIIHCPLPKGINDFFGLSPLHVLAMQSGLNTQMTTFHNAVFRNGGMVTGLLTYERELDDDEPEQIRNAWRRRFSGANAGNVAILEGGAKFQQVGLDLDKMAMPEQWQMTESAVCGVFGVPPSTVFAMVGLLRNTFTNAEEEQRKYWVNTLLPLLKRQSEQLQVGLEPDFPGNWVLEADTSTIRALGENEDEKYTRHLAALNAGGIMLDEFRTSVGLDPVGGRAGKTFHIPVNLGLHTLDELNAPPPPIPPPVTVQNGANPPNAAPNPTLGPPNKGVGTPLLPVGGRTRSLPPRQELHLERLKVGRLKYEPAMVADLQKFHESLLSRVNGKLGRGIPSNPAELIPSEADGALSQIFKRYALLMAQETWRQENDSGLVGDVMPDLNTTQTILADAASRASFLNDVSRLAIGDILAAVHERGYSAKQLAEGVPAEQFPGIRSLITEKYKQNAAVMAHLELAQAQVTTQKARYEASGMQPVEVDSGDGDGDVYLLPIAPEGA